MTLFRIDVALALTAATWSFSSQNLLLLFLGALAVQAVTFGRWFPRKPLVTLGAKALYALAFLFALWSVAALASGLLLQAGAEGRWIQGLGSAVAVGLIGTAVLSANVPRLWEIMGQNMPSDPE